MRTAFFFWIMVSVSAPGYSYAVKLAGKKRIPDGKFSEPTMEKLAIPGDFDMIITTVKTPIKTTPRSLAKIPGDFDMVITTKAPPPPPTTTTMKAPPSTTTQAPTTTSAPTQAPTTTSAPTQAPTTTSAPTQAPTTTSAPTQASPLSPTTQEPAAAMDILAAPEATTGSTIANLLMQRGIVEVTTAMAMNAVSNITTPTTTATTATTTMNPVLARGAAAAITPAMAAMTTAPATTTINPVVARGAVAPITPAMAAGTTAPVTTTMNPIMARGAVAPITPAMAAMTTAPATTTMNPIMARGAAAAITPAMAAMTTAPATTTMNPVMARGAAAAITPAMAAMTTAPATTSMNPIMARGAAAAITPAMAAMTTAPATTTMNPIMARGAAAAMTPAMAAMTTAPATTTMNPVVARGAVAPITPAMAAGTTAPATTTINPVMARGAAAATTPAMAAMTTATATTPVPDVALHIQDIKTLFNALLTNYDTRIRPRRDQAMSVKVYTTFIPNSIIEFDTQEQKFAIMGYFKIEWWDQLLGWTPADYSGADTLKIPAREIWTPSLVIGKAFNGKNIIGQSSSDIVLVHWLGYVQWVPEGTYSIVCEVNIQFYPFDIQTCDLTYYISGETSDNVNLTFSGRLDLSELLPNSEWDVLNVTTSTATKNNATHVSFSFTVKRRGEFALFTVIMPLLMLSCLNGFVFLVPIDTGEKGSFAITIFLAYGVFVTIVIDTLPHNSLQVCYFVLYILSLLALSVFLVFYTILQSKIVMKLGDKPCNLKVPFRKPRAVAPESDNMIGQQVFTWRMFLKRVDTWMFVVFAVVVISDTSMFLVSVVEQLRLF